MNVEIGTEAPIFLFWEYLFRNFGILSLQCTWGSSTWALLAGCPPFYSVSFSTMCRNTDHLLLLVKRKLLLTHCSSLETGKRDREKTHLFNIWTIGAMDRTSGQPQVKLSLLRSIIRPEDQSLFSSTGWRWMKDRYLYSYTVKNG